MTITYHGHSTFRLRGKKGTVITDPYDDYVGFSLGNLSADMVTVSHQHPDHNAAARINATTRRKNPFIVTHAGEYEVEGISIFGVESYHDSVQGAERGDNIIFTTYMDGIRVCHLGDLGHELSTEQVERVGNVDVLLVPVGGVYTIGPTQAVKIIRSLEPSYVIPMHYKAPQHREEVFGELKTLEDFLREYGSDATPVEKLEVERGRLPEETELVVLAQL
jgi:L-ascorbate metabolism protein UlaG (beta-lactamase superfamily)